MLIEFRVENHRSIRDEQALSMEAGSIGVAEDPRPRRVVGHDKALLTVAAIYGPNASGKSNVLSAFRFMSRTVVDSYRMWEPGAPIHREPFAWGEGPTKGSLFEVTALIEGTRYQYGFVVGNTSVEEEWLFAWPKRRKQTWFTREKGVIEIGPTMAEAKRLPDTIDRPNSLFLSIVAQHGYRAALPLFQWFREARSQGDYPGANHWLSHIFGLPRLPGMPAPDGADWTTEAKRLDAIREILRAADVGITDVRMDDSSNAIRIRHTGSDEAWLDLHQESSGTQTLYHLAPTLIETLRKGNLLVVDELEQSLHPHVAAQIVSLFNDRRTNPKNAQLLFSTHDTNLLGSIDGEPVLRRDQIWLTEKDSAGGTTLYPLTDYKPRKGENLERGYLQGRFGAIPGLLPIHLPDGG